jgi:hypothetical protein
MPVATFHYLWDSSTHSRSQVSQPSSTGACSRLGISSATVWKWASFRPSGRETQIGTHCALGLCKQRVLADMQHKLMGTSNYAHDATPEGAVSVTIVTSGCACEHDVSVWNNFGRANRYSGIQFGPMNSRRACGVAQGAEFVKRFTQSGPSPIFTRSGVNSGESVLAIRA